LRNLLIRGLIERVQNPQDQRSFLYRPSFDLLQYLGVSRVDELPDYEATRSKLAAFLQQQEEDTSSADEQSDTHEHAG
jgi:chromosome segregation and condensation protein ScpB